MTSAFSASTVKVEYASFAPGWFVGWVVMTTLGTTVSVTGLDFVSPARFVSTALNLYFAVLSVPLTESVAVATSL